MRYHQLDGLRGVAALVVAIHHFVTAFLPAAYFGRENGAPTWLEHFSAGPLLVPIAGSFAVFVFFVLSGFAISASADKLSTPLAPTVLARIIRLSLPAGVAIGIGFAANRWLQGYVPAAGVLVGHEWLKNVAYTIEPMRALKEAIGGYYFEFAKSDPVLWTMQLELIGSIWVYAVFRATSSSLERALICAGSIVAVRALYVDLHDYYMCFGFGMLAYLMRDMVARIPAKVALAILFAGVVLGSRPFHAPDPGWGSFYSMVRLFAPSYWYLVWPIGAAGVVVGALALRQGVFESSLAQFLGRVSFGLYLVHFPVLLSLGTASYVLLDANGSVLGLLSTFAVYIIAALGLASIFTLLVDEPAIHISRAARRWRAAAPTADSVTNCNAQ